MRPLDRTVNPLDLNNLPDDYTKQQLFHDDTSSSGTGGGYGNGRRKKNGGKEDGKVYECRFCSLKFCKSQALGGHMNRHRQERETETLNRARQLVFNNDTQGTPHLSCQPVAAAGGCYHPAGGDQTMSYRPLYSPRLFPPTPPQAVVPPPQPYPYPSPSRRVSYPHAPINDYYVGHVLGSSNHYGGGAAESYTCVGAPVGHGEEGLSWGRTYGGGTAQGQQQPW